MQTRSARTRRLVPGQRHLHPVNQIHHDEATFGERLADRISAGIGSWTFLIVQGVLIVGWILANLVLLLNHGWDPFPFILLNLMFSIQAAYTGPVLLLAGNRHAQHDRLRLEHTSEVNERSEKRTLEILEEIERNTACTLKILEHIKKRREQKGITAPI